jgi:hypothetical protein
MSRRSSSDDVTPDVYTALLFVSLAAILTGIAFLLIELSQYKFQLS